MSGNQINSSNHVFLDAEPDVQCLVCTRPFTLDTEVNDSFEALAICRECKTTVLNNNNRDENASIRRETRRQRPRSRATRFESFDAAFSQRPSHLINLATQDHEVDTDTPPVSREQTSFTSTTSTPNRSERWHASDDESDGLNYVDSMFGETESYLSFGDDGGESDASLDQRARMGREIVIQLDSESYLNIDIDIDPMNAGMDVWDTDDQDDEESEEFDFDEVVETMQQRQQRQNSIAPRGFNEHESEDVAWTSGTAIPRTVGVINLRADVEEPAIRRHFIGNPGDYVNARQFEMLLDQFAEDNNTRRGAPPAAKSIVENLPSVVISTSHETDGGVTCPVCKDNMSAKTVAKQLPCAHLYHSSCILPWLNYRNTCPACRYELPTDDLEYERSKQATTNERGIHGVEHIHPQEPVEELSDGPEGEGAFNTHSGTTEEANTNEHSVHDSQHPNRARGHQRWLVIAAAPVVSLVGLALVLCFANSSSNARRQLWRRSQSTTTSHVDTKRSWWSIF